MYVVNPSYALITPNGKIEIKFCYYVNNLKEDPTKHKFKFEGIVLEEAQKDSDMKVLFDYYAQNKIAVKGTIIKSGVIFNMGDNNVQQQNVRSSPMPNENKHTVEFTPENNRIE